MAKEEKKAPKLRFNGYTNDWEQVKLGDVAEITPGGTPSKNISDYWYPKEIPWLSSGEINKEIIFSTNDMISKKGFNNSSAKWINQNSVLIALAGQGKTRGKVAINRIPLTTNQSIAGIDPSDEIYYKFLYHQLTKDYLKLRLISSGDGSRGGLNKKLLNDYAVNLSGIDEQHKIGVLLSHIDNTLQLHERKCKELALIKKALLQKLFPKKDEFKPEVHYKNFSDAWEQRKLGEIGKVFTGNTPSTKNTENWTTDKSIGHVWITPTDINNNIMFDSERYLSDKGWSQARVVPKNSVLITSIASIGKNAINGVEVAFNQQINALVVQKNNPYFILTLMNKEKQRFESLAGQTATPIINKSTFSSFMVKIPSETEQKHIGYFFNQLDSLITLHQRKLEKLKQLKKFLLQNMFI